MRRARSVAARKSASAPVVTASGPKTRSSAARPAMATAMSASSLARDTDTRSPSGSRTTMPSARPRGMMVALWMGSASGQRMETSACPAS